MFKKYYRLTKPGIIYGNLLSVIAGFFLASRGHFQLRLFAATVAGIALVMAAGCVFNNFIDRDIDARMARTKKRALVAGTISTPMALGYGAVLGIVGLALLIIYANWLTALVAAFGLFAYVVMYGWAKRKTTYSTLIGSISGAVPPVVGYCAVSGRLDLGAWLVFAVLVFWQMPHFYAIGIFRHDEYKKAGLPILPVRAGVSVAKRHIFAFILLFMAATTQLYAQGYTGLVYLVVMAVIGLWWLYRAWLGFSVEDNEGWARKLFFQSLIVLLTFTTITSLDWWLA